MLPWVHIPAPGLMNIPGRATAPSTATLASSAHHCQPCGEWLPTGTGPQPPAAASPGQGPFKDHCAPQASTTGHLELRHSALGAGQEWHRAHGTGLVTNVGAGLEALALGLKVVPVATAATIDELLTLLAGCIEEEAAEECLAAPADRRQVAEVCMVRENRLSQGWQMDATGLSTPSTPGETSTAPFPF